MSAKSLLYCGIIASALYFLVNIITPLMYEGYSVAHQTVSELSAIGTPTRTFWVIGLTIYSFLMIAFGWGVIKSAAGNKHIRKTGQFILIYTIFGMFWPPMHQREVLAIGGGTLTDILHIAWTAVTVPLMIISIGFGAASFGKQFKIYSIVTIIVLIATGGMTSINAGMIERNLPTPWIGVWERISINVFMIWVIVLAMVLLKYIEVPLKKTRTIKYKAEHSSHKLSDF